jgi:hypothetical protein
MGSAVSFALIAPITGADRIGPSVLFATAEGQDVVDGVQGLDDSRAVLPVA